LFDLPRICLLGSLGSPGLSWSTPLTEDLVQINLTLALSASNILTFFAWRKSFRLAMKLFAFAWSTFWKKEMRILPREKCSDMIRVRCVFLCMCVCVCVCALWTIANTNAKICNNLFSLWLNIIWLEPKKCFFYLNWEKNKPILIRKRWEIEPSRLGNKVEWNFVIEVYKFEDQRGQRRV